MRLCELKLQRVPSVLETFLERSLNGAEELQVVAKSISHKGIGRVSRPLHALDIFSLKGVIHQDRKITRRVINHEYEYRTNSGLN